MGSNNSTSAKPPNQENQQRSEHVSRSRVVQPKRFPTNEDENYMATVPPPPYSSVDLTQKAVRYEPPSVSYQQQSSTQPSHVQSKQIYNPSYQKPNPKIFKKPAPPLTNHSHNTRLQAQKATTSTNISQNPSPTYQPSDNPFKWVSDATQSSVISHGPKATATQKPKQKQKPKSIKVFPQESRSRSAASSNQSPLSSPSYQQMNDPYKWTNDATQSSVINPNQPKLPTYEQSTNPYVWMNNETDSQTKKRIVSKEKNKVFDLDLSNPDLLGRIKKNPDENYQTMLKQLNNSTKPLVENRKKMVNSEFLSDARFILNEGKIFYAHKMYLITSSLLFFEHFEKNCHDEMKIDSIDYDTFHKVMTYCYTDQLKPTEHDVQDLVAAANKLQIRQITNICSGFVTSLMSPDSIFIIYEKALSIDNELYMKKCLDFIMKNEDECFSSKGFFNLTVPTLYKILEACKFPASKTEEIVGKHMFLSSKSQDILLPQDPPQQQQSNNKPKAAPKKPKNKIKPIPIPDLMSLPTMPPPPFPMFPPQQNQMPSQMFTNSNSSVIGKIEPIKTQISIIGDSHKYSKTISTLGLICKRSMRIHEIRFTENLASNCKRIKLSIWIVNHTVGFLPTEHELHARNFDITAATNKVKNFRLHFVNLSEGTNIYIGQKFYIKLEFCQAIDRAHIDANYLTPNEYLELYSFDGNKHFNCIKSLTVSDI